MAYILNQKYTNAMPLYRQEQEFKRYGIELNRQNLSNWTIKGATLLKPLVLSMKKNCFPMNYYMQMKLLWKYCMNRV